MIYVGLGLGDGDEVGQKIWVEEKVLLYIFLTRLDTLK